MTPSPPTAWGERDGARGGDGRCVEFTEPLVVPPHPAPSPPGRRGEREWCAALLAARELDARDPRRPVERPGRLQVLGREPERAVVGRIHRDRAVVAPARESSGLGTGAVVD